MLRKTRVKFRQLAGSFNILNSVNVRRFTALFFVFVLVVSTVTPIAPWVASVAAEDQESKTTSEKVKSLPVETPALRTLNSESASASDIPSMSDTPQKEESEQRVKDHEDMTLRTANTKTYVNTDGSKTMEYSVVPKHYQKDGKWEDVNTSLTGDGSYVSSQSIEGEPLISNPFADKPQALSGSSADLKASLKPFNDGIQVTFRDKTFKVTPVGASNVRPRLSSPAENVQLVTYPEAWPGVDVEYELRAGSLKETIILKRPGLQNVFVFALDGITAKDDTLHKGGLALEGIDPNDFFIAPLTVTVNKRGMISEQVTRQTTQGKTIAITVDADWLKGLPEESYPIAIDPTFENNVGGTYGNFYAYKSDGYSCSSATCDPQAGTVYDGGWKSWRTAFRIPFDQLQGKVLLGASLHLNKQVRSYYTGTDATKWFAQSPASCGGYNCSYTQGQSFGQVTTNDWVNVTPTLKWMVDNGQWSAWFFMWGEETQAESYKRFEPLSLSMGVSYDTPTPISPPVAPADKQVVVTTQPSLSATPVTDPDGDQVQYYFRVATNSDAETGAVINSGWINSSQWTVPDGVLQDGSTYYWHVYTRGVTQTNPNTIRSFKVDLRTGKDSTQAYEEVGPIGVDLATGNTTTANTSHGISALGGTIGLNLAYNSPANSQMGLKAEYWNVSQSSPGIPNTPPTMTRTDPNVDFNYDQGNPGGGINNDWFAARWTGYFVAPSTDTFTFGGGNDDNMKVWINNQQVYGANCYTGYTGSCWGTTTIALTAGQVVPIKVEFAEAIGNSYARMLIKSTNNTIPQQVVPKEWLRTEVKATAKSTGLTGYYYTDTGSHTFPSNESDPTRLTMVRTDPTVSFYWSEGGPMPGGPTDNFMVRWKGYIIVPNTGSYNFGAFTDDGVKVKITTPTTDVTVLDSWQDQAVTQWGSAGQAITLTENQAYPITVEYYEHAYGASIDLLVKGPGLDPAGQAIPAGWLSPSANVLPDGWQMGVDVDGNIGYERLRATTSTVVLYDATGTSHEYTYVNGGYKPPVNEEGMLVRNSDGTYTLTDADGRIYIFSTEGKLTSVVSPQDDKNPTALKYEYGGSPSRLLKISDGVDSSRYGQLYYSGDSECSTPTGFDPAPAGMLCAFKTTDNAKTQFYYKSSRLVRIEKSGSEVTDYGYDSLGRITSFRDSLAADAIAASVRADDATATTTISYDIIGRASSVTAPAPTTGATQQVQTFEYLPAAGSYAGATQQHVSGNAEPNGFSHRVEYDALYRTVRDVDVANLATSTLWDPVKDLKLSSTDATGLKSTVIYDTVNDRPIDSYGPAPAAWFDSTTRLPLTTYVNQVPHAQTNYDENIQGLGISIYNNKKLLGAPKVHATGFNNVPYASYGVDASAGVVTFTDGAALRATGKMLLSQTGNYSFRAWHSDGMRIYVDNQLIVDNWVDGGERFSYSGAYNNTVANRWVDYRVDVYRTGTSGRVFAQLFRTPPGGSEQADIAGFMTPNYGLSTSSKVFDAQAGDVTSTTSYGSKPELGQANSTVIDPTGLNLTGAATYEPYQTGSLLRQTGKTLPGGNSYAYQYYGATETRANPCDSNSPAVSQAGMSKGKTEPDPDNNSSTTNQPGINAPRTSESVYDAAGRVVASRMNNDAWTCVTYDSRGRAAQTVTPTINGRAGRTVTGNYAVSGNPLVTSQTDSVTGTTTVTRDLLGRVVATTDTFGYQTTTTYDNLGRVSQQVSPKGTEVPTYDNLNRVTGYALDGTAYATMTYDQYSRVATVEYPQSQTGGNKLTLSQIQRDNLQRTTGSTYTFSNSTTFTENVTLNQQRGVVTGYTDTFGGVTAGATYQYDKAGRMTQATVDTMQYQYAFGTQAASCTSLAGYNANAHKNSNRTTYTVTNLQTSAATTTNNCYNNADQLVSSTDVQIGTPTYDDHGNTTQLAGNGTPITFTYDALDANTVITQGNNKVEYTKSASGAVLAKKEYRNNTLDKVYRYAAGVLITCDVANQSNCSVADKYISLPGGVSLTLRSSGNVYSIKNFHGDTALTVAPTGLPSSGVYLYDPFGQAIASTAFGTSGTPSNSSNQGMGWAANPTRKAEAGDLFTIPIIQMGARVYLPTMGRFLQVDPVEGGTPNAYVYPADPVNGSDYTGMASIFDAVLGLKHYIFGGGKSKSYSVNQFSWNTKSIAKSIVNNNKRQGTQNYGVPYKNGFIKTGMQPTELGGRGTIGQVTGHFAGTIKVDGNKWEVKGMVRATSYYDFNIRDTKRNPAGQASTIAGAFIGWNASLLPGIEAKNYDEIINGVIVINESGTF